MHILVWILIGIMAVTFYGALTLSEMTDENFDMLVKMLMRKIRLNIYFSKLIRELKRA